MDNKKTIDRRKFLNFARISITASSMSIFAKNPIGNSGTIEFFSGLQQRNHIDPTMANIKQIDAGVLSIGYAEFGPPEGTPVVLLHGWPYDIHSYVHVAPLLAKEGMRVIVPHLRGHGTTIFLDPKTPRAGQQAAVGSDVIALLDALKIKKAVLAGYDWGARAACVAAAIWPERCLGLVSVNSYLIEDIPKVEQPFSSSIEADLSYQYYFLTERGKKGLDYSRKQIARVMWNKNSPGWGFSDNEFERSLPSFENPDYVDIVIHSYRHRLGTAKGYPEYEDLEKKLALQPAITVPSITLDGLYDGAVKSNDGKLSAHKFTGFREHRIVQNAGHNLPQENPGEFTQAILDLFS